MGKTYRKYHFNTRIFRSINTPSKAYWLGFLIADGSICKKKGIRIKLSKKDRDHLVKFRDFLEFKDSPYKIHSYHDHTVSLTVYSVDMVDDLAEYGVVPNKSKKTYLPETNDQYIDHLIRGIFDGDGSIYITNRGYPRWFLAGTEQLLQSVIDHMDIVLDCSITGPYKNRGDSYLIQKGSMSGVKKILHYMYNDSTMDNRLTRKWKTVNNICNL